MADEVTGTSHQPILTATTGAGSVTFRTADQEKKWLESKKFWATMATIIFMLLTDVFGFNLSQETFTAIWNIMLVYLLGQGSIDVVKLIPNVLDAVSQLRKPRVTPM